MSESWEDRKSRLELMAAGDDQWDLSDNDMAAISEALSQLSQLRAELAEREAKIAHLDETCGQFSASLLEWENEEASVCPEDVGFVEFIGVLQKRLAERDGMLLAMRETALKIHHWHDWGRNNEGMVVSSESVRELWDVLTSTSSVAEQAVARVKAEGLREAAAEIRVIAKLSCDERAVMEVVDWVEQRAAALAAEGERNG